MLPKQLTLSPDDLDALARIVKAEAGNQSDAGQLGVLYTVLNRVASNGAFPDSVIDVIQQRGQFEPLSGKKSVFDLPEAPEVQSKVANWVSGIMSGQLADPTNGATFFQNEAITNQRGTNFAASAPTAVIGDHSFFNQYKKNNPVEVPAFSIAMNSLPQNERLASDNTPSQQGAPDFRALMQAPAYGSVEPASYTGEGFLQAAAIMAGRPYVRPSAPSPVPAGTGAGMASIYAQQPNQPAPDLGPSQQMIGHEQATATAIAPTFGSSFGLKAANDGVDLSGLNPNVTSAANTVANYLGRDLIVNSGFRSQDKQDRIRNSGDPNRITVAKHSAHTEGDALDLPTAGMSDEEITQLVDALAAAGFTGFGYYGKGKHLHADFRDQVPKSFNPDNGWGGWTSLPASAMQALVARGFSRGAKASDLRRGFSQQLMAGL